MALLIPFVVPAAAQDELEGYVAAMRRQMDDTARPLGERSQRALEAAAALDRAARAAEDGRTARGHWMRAADLIEAFRGAIPDNPRADELLLQAAIYRWATARSWIGQSELDPTDPQAARAALETLELARTLLKEVLARIRPRADPLDQEARFRLAVVLADRASLTPDSNPTRRTTLDEALAVLPPKAEVLPQLVGRMELIRGDLLERAGRPAEALEALDVSDGASPPSPLAERIEARSRSMAALDRYDEAMQVIERADLDARLRSRLAIQVRLLEWASRPAGAGREAAARDAIARAVALQESKSPDARMALIGLARAISEPPEAVEPAGLARLAEGRTLLGDLGGAASLYRTAAAAQRRSGDQEAAGDLDYRAAALLVRAGRNAEADAVLSTLGRIKSAGPVRSRALLLRALNREAAMGRGLAGLDLSAYRAALIDLVHAAPDDPAGQEGRWRLGQVRYQDGDPDGARALWSVIPRTHERWLESRLAIARLNLDPLEPLIVDPDRPRPAEPQALERARAFLNELEAQAVESSERAEFALERLRLELSPSVTNVEEARRRIERLATMPMTPGHRRRLDASEIVLWLRSGRTADAESRARELVGLVTTPRPAWFLDLAWLIDRGALSSRTDVDRRRHGSVLRILSQGAASDGRGTTEERLVWSMLETRALSYAGQSEASARIATRLLSQAGTIRPPLLIPMAQTVAIVGNLEAATRLYEDAANRVQAGSPLWYEARYGLALTLAQARRPDEARRVIEATLLIHPDAGRPERLRRFEDLLGRLRPAR